MHCPTAGPNLWDQAVIKIYIDGETVPSISVTVPELANGSPWGSAGDDGPWGIGLMGHTAANGGVYSTVRIPFGRSQGSQVGSGRDYQRGWGLSVWCAPLSTASPPLPALLAVVLGAVPAAREVSGGRQPTHAAEPPQPPLIQPT